MNIYIKTPALQQLKQHLRGTHEPREYLGGLEFRAIGGLDQMKQEAQHIIDVNQLPLEIFKVDIRVRSISVRELPEPHPEGFEP